MKKITLFTILLCLLTSATFAQRGDTTRNETKRGDTTRNETKRDYTKNGETKLGDTKRGDTTEITVASRPEAGTLQAEWQPVIMDHYIGIRGGYGMGQGRFEPRREMSGYMGMINLGLTYRFDAPKQKYVGCIEIDLNYMQKGFKYETSYQSGRFYSRKYSIIELPILWQPYLPLSSKNSSNRFFLNAGPYLGYAIGTGSFMEFTNDATIAEGSYEFFSSRDNFAEYGIVVGAGIQLAVKRFVFGIDFRYNIMMSNSMKPGNSYPGNPSRSPVDQMNISFALGYKFINKGTVSKSK